jgi:TPR repeat protein
MRKTGIILVLLMLFAAASYAADPPAAQAIPGGTLAPDDVTAGMYFWGYGVKRDYARAMQLWHKTADKGDALASFNIGAMYQDGWGVPRDLVEAMKWFRRAAYLGNPNAQRNMGEVYGGGWGVKQDFAEATRWYDRAAGQGDYIAQFTMGDLYAKGEGGLKQDYAQALLWFNLAAGAKKNNAEGSAAYNSVENFDPTIVAFAAKQRDTIVAKATADQASQAQRLVAAWKPTSYQLFTGKANPADVIEESAAAIAFHDYQVARQLLLPLADRGNAQAQEMVGTLYAIGADGANKNYASAMEWYQNAAKQGNARAEVAIGWMYENGWGVRRDQVEAVKWYRKAAEQGNDVAQRNIGNAYAGGWAGVKQDYAEAAKWYTQAANQGDYVAQYTLGGMYAEGKPGVNQDNVQALMWLTLAGATLRDADKYDFTFIDIFDGSIVEYARKQKDALAAKMPQDQVTRAQSLVAGWKQSHGSAAGP